MLDVLRFFPQERESAVSEAYAKGLKEGKEQAGSDKQQAPVNLTDEVSQGFVYFWTRLHLQQKQTYIFQECLSGITCTLSPSPHPIRLNKDCLKALPGILSYKTH